MKTQNLAFAINYRDSAFETCNVSLMIVMLENGWFQTMSRKAAAKMEKAGYEIF